jgi:hypothetical protein
VREAGFETRALPEVPADVFRTDQGLRWLTPSYFEQNVDAERSILAEEKPDAVVFDFRFTTALSARLSDLPSASILHGNAIRLARQPRQTARLLVGDPAEARGVTALRIAVMRRLFPAGFSAIMRRAVRQLWPFLEAHDLPPVDSPFQLLEGDAVLVADIADFVPPDLPSNYHVVGPLTWSGWEARNPAHDLCDDGKHRTGSVHVAHDHRWPARRPIQRRRQHRQSVPAIRSSGAPARARLFDRSRRSRRPAQPRRFPPRGPWNVDAGVGRRGSITDVADERRSGVGGATSPGVGRGTQFAAARRDAVWRS